MLPELSAWDLETVRGLLRLGRFEGEQFDLKEMLPDRRADDAKLRLRKTVAAFANSILGGFVVFGIEDDKRKCVDDRLVGCEPALDFPEHFGAHPASCRPSVVWTIRSPAIVLPTGKLIHVVFIPPSVSRPHAVETRDGGLVFPKRTHKGNETMSYEEVRQTFQMAEWRRSRLGALASELDHLQSLAQRVYSEILSLRVDVQRGVRPFGLVHAAWATRYPTLLLDAILGDVHSLLAADAVLWQQLRAVRTAATHHNAVAEAITAIVHVGALPPQFVLDHYQSIEPDTEIIVSNANVAAATIRAAM